MKDKLNILIANDDGIDSPGIVRLAEAASKFGNVWVAAPSSQCSGMSQKLTIFGEFPVSRPAFPVPVMDAWSIGGTPADCVKLAVNFLMPVKPDVVFSGINFGYNTGFDIAYSGTVGAAMEALINGIPAIAFSSQHDGSSDVTDKYLVPVIEELLSSPIGRGEIWNVNFPGCALEDCRGILRERIPAPLCVFDNHYDKTEQPDGSFILRPYAEQLSPDRAPEGSDIHAVFNGYVSIGKVRSMVL